MSAASKTIVFLHPDLGIGGAERLVIDAAVGLQKLGHKIVVFTSHCDPSHCFDEARDGTLDVRVRGNWLIPATILGRFKILCAILRQLHLLFTVTVSGELRRLQPDVFFVDQLSAGIPILRWRWADTRVLFYCHFPDLLLVQGRQRLSKKIWRLGFDWLEGWGIRGADRVVVNSRFTKSVVEGVWKGLGGKRGVGVVYPCVDTNNFEKEENKTDEKHGLTNESSELWKGKKVLLSINRFERKKDVGLAVRAFAGLKAEDRKGVRLVLAGGYDVLVEENVSYHTELLSLSESLKLKTATARNIVSALNIPDDIEVLFLLSVPAQLKNMLLKAATILLYTPSNEHFGIVPLEAMLAGVPVLAANSGGPLETVVDGETGWLRPVDEPAAWTNVMQEALHGMSREQLHRMGQQGQHRVKADFSDSKMAHRLDDEIENMVKSSRQDVIELPDILLGMGLLGVVILVLYAVTFRIYQNAR